jgi:hypothetical protein
VRGNLLINTRYRERCIGEIKRKATPAQTHGNQTPSAVSRAPYDARFFTP